MSDGRIANMPVHAKECKTERPSLGCCSAPGSTSVDYETGPVERTSSSWISKEDSLRFGQCCDRRFTLRSSLVEFFHQGCSCSIIDRPERSEHAACTRLQKRFDQSDPVVARRNVRDCPRPKRGP